MNSVSIRRCLEGISVEQDTPNLIRMTAKDEVFKSQAWRKMKKYGVFASLDDTTLARREDSQDIIFESFCETSTGYFLDADGLEIPEEDLDVFLADLLPEGMSLTIEGHYDVFDGCRIVNEAEYLNRNGEILRNVNRYSVSAESGQIQQIRRVDEITNSRLNLTGEASNVISLNDYRRRRCV